MMIPFTFGCMTGASIFIAHLSGEISAEHPGRSAALYVVALILGVGSMIGYRAVSL